MLRKMWVVDLVCWLVLGCSGIWRCRRVGWGILLCSRNWRREDRCSRLLDAREVEEGLKNGVCLPRCRREGCRWGFPPVGRISSRALSRAR